MTDASVTAVVCPAGRWAWHVTVNVVTPTSWIAREAWSGIVLGSRARADRIARRKMVRELAWQHRVATETHTLDAPQVDSTPPPDDPRVGLPTGRQW